MKYRFVSLVLLLLLGSVLCACGHESNKEMMAEGQQCFDEGNYQGAIVIFKTVLENSPEEMEARLGLGKAYLMSGKLDQAEKSLEKYARQNPYDPALLLETGRLKLFKKNFQEAFDNFSAYVGKVNDSAEGYNLLGQAAWALGKFDEAKHDFIKAIELAPSLEAPRLALAQLYLIDDNEAEAEKVISVLMEEDPNNREGLYFKARIAQRHGDAKEYKAVFKRIVQAYPADAYAKYTYAKSLIEEGESDQVEGLIQELTKGAPRMPFGKKLRGMKQYVNKNYRGAVNSFHEAIAVRPDIESYFLLGMSYYGLGDLETAITQLRIAADRSEKFVKAREMISLILLQQKRFNESIAEAQKILEFDPDNVIASVILGDAYSAKGDMSKALEKLKDITEKDPHFAAAFLKMGALHYAMGDLEESEEALKGAMKAAPDKLRPRLVLSGFYLRNGNTSLAKKVLEDGLTGTKEDVALYVALARMELRDRNPEKARELLSKAKLLDLENPTTYMILASMALTERKPEDALSEYDALLEKKSDLRVQLAKAAVLDTLDRSDEAEEVYKAAVESGNQQAYLAYAGSRQKAGDYEGALAVLEEGLKHAPNNARLIKMKAETLYGMKRFDDVLAMCDKVEKLNREAGLSLRVRTFVLMGELEKAIASARQMCDFSPKSPTSYIVLADVYRRANRLDDWGKTLEQAVSRCGSVPILLQELGKYYAARGDNNKALTYLDSVIRQNEKAFQAYSMRGDVYVGLGRKDRAIEDYTKALELSDRHIPALNNLAMLYLENGKTAAEALRLAYKAYLQAPWNPSVMDTFGYALAVNDKQDAAISVLEKAIAVNPDNPEIEYHLGFAYSKAGKTDLAIAELEKVANCDGCGNASAARKLLKQIKGD